MMSQSAKQVSVYCQLPYQHLPGAATKKIEPEQNLDFYLRSGYTKPVEEDLVDKIDDFLSKE